MNSKETKIQIEVKVGEEHIWIAVPFSQQDEVRRIESELKIYLRELQAQKPNRWQSTYLAMAAYEFASRYFHLKGQYEKESEEAEDLLMEMSQLLGEAGTEEDSFPSSESDVY